MQNLWIWHLNRRCSNYDTWTVELLHIVHAKLFLFAKKMKDSDYNIVFFTAYTELLLVSLSDVTVTSR